MYDVNGFPSIAMSTRRSCSLTTTEIRSAGFGSATRQQTKNAATAKITISPAVPTRIDHYPSFKIKSLPPRHKAPDNSHEAADWLRHRQSPAPSPHRIATYAPADTKHSPDAPAS